MRYIVKVNYLKFEFIHSIDAIKFATLAYDTLAERHTDGTPNKEVYVRLEEDEDNGGKA